jgi:hypothetical protein
MTPARLAAAMAALEKARAAPKEKVYRPTAKRRAANLANLEIANAKRRQEVETLRAGLEATFPAPESEFGIGDSGFAGEEGDWGFGVGDSQKEAQGGSSCANPESRIPNPGSSAKPESRTPEPGTEEEGDLGFGVRDSQSTETDLPSSSANPESRTPNPGDEELDQAAPLIARRLRLADATARREGRRIMRLLTAAACRSQPLTADEAFALARKLVEILSSGVPERAGGLNARIQQLLRKMLETRYGEGAQYGGVPLAAILEEVMEARRLRLEQARAARKARQAARGETSGEASETESDGAAPAAGATESAGQPANKPPKEPPLSSAPDLPEDFEEFVKLVTRALGLEGRLDDRHLGRSLAVTLWERLQLWKERAEWEREELRDLFQRAATPPDTVRELQYRTQRINVAVELHEEFLARRAELTRRVQEDIEGWLLHRAGVRGESPPAKPPQSTQSDQAPGSLADEPQVA